MNPLNILVLAAYPPGLGLHGGAQRMYYNLKILAAKHRVTLISFIEHECERELLERLKPLGVEARAVRRLPVPVRHLWIPRPAEHYEFAGAEMAAEVRQVLGSRRFDVIQAEYLQMAQHVPRDAVRRKVLTLHEVQYANAAQAFERAGSPWTGAGKWYDWMVQLNYEVRSCARFDAVVCMTGEDAQLLAEFVPPSKLCTIPIGVDSGFFRSGPVSGGAGRKKRMLFVGNYRHTPNQESVHHMVERILPGILRRVPEAEFWVAGGNSRDAGPGEAGPSCRGPPARLRRGSPAPLPGVRRFRRPHPLRKRHAGEVAGGAFHGHGRGHHAAGSPGVPGPPRGGVADCRFPGGLCLRRRRVAAGQPPLPGVGLQGSAS